MDDQRRLDKVETYGREARLQQVRFGTESKWNQIDWARIGRAVEYYTERYAYVEAPWVVDEKYSDITFPGALKITPGSLVGSAEQGLLSLSAEGKIRDKCQYVACGPCFRAFGPTQPDDKFHNLYFMKVELYLPMGHPNDIGQMMGHAAKFFASEGAVPEIVETEAGWDINVAGIEVGSYGYRSVYDHKWVYATGLAEPRFSQALSLQNEYIAEMTHHE
jgi:hypothetical protein